MSKTLASRADASGTEDVRIHKLSELFRNGSMTYDVWEDLRAELNEGPEVAILDLAGVEYMSSCGVGLLAALYTSTRAAGRALMFVAPHPRVATILRVTGLLPIIPTFDSVEDALPVARRGAGMDSIERPTGTG